MSDQVPGWLESFDRPADHTVESEHLRVLRALLAKDYFASADWNAALHDLATMVREGVDADRAVVAWRTPRGWRAVDDAGEALDGPAISARASFGVLERVAEGGEPLLTTATNPLPVHTHSVMQHDIRSVAAVPLFFWDVQDAGGARELGGVVYAHRTSTRDPFSLADIDLVLDIARICQPTLTLLRHLNTLQHDLAVHQEALDAAVELGETTARLGELKTRDRAFGRKVLGPLRRVAAADRVGLLILGPSGSGKTHLARAYHRTCSRARGPFVTLDCSQVTSVETLSAELFGYAARSGYANSPQRGRPGKALLAHGGTLFVDEVGTLPPELQQKLLRLVQEGTFSPLGAADEERVDVQVIAATNEDLRALVDEGRFREDLYWRLGEVVVEVPPLDARPADVGPLAKTFLARAARRFGRADVEELSLAAVHVLQRHRWSAHGNIRGLEHTINRAVLMSDPGVRVIGPEHLELGSLSVRPARQGRAAVLRAAMRRANFNASAMTRDPVLLQAVGRAELPVSTLASWLRSEGLAEEMREGRRSQGDQLETIRQAIRTHGTATSAAKALGMTRDALIWRLRKAQLTVGDVLRGAS